MGSTAGEISASMLGLALCLLPVAAKAAPEDEAAIRALENRLAAAVEAKDPAAVMRAYLPSESLFVFDVIPPRQYVGAKAFGKDWAEYLETFKGPLRYEISDLAVAADGTMGFAHSIQHINGIDTKDQPVDMTFRVTDVYRKINGHWLIVHEHISVPVDVDSGKADLDSKP